MVDARSTGAKSSYRRVDEVSVNSENSASDVTSYSGLCSEGRPICVEPKSIDSSVSSPLESKVSSINLESKDSSAGVGTRFATCLWITFAICPLLLLEEEQSCCS